MYFPVIIHAKQSWEHTFPTCCYHGPHSKWRCIINVKNPSIHPNECRLSLRSVIPWTPYTSFDALPPVILWTPYTSLHHLSYHEPHTPQKPCSKLICKTSLPLSIPHGSSASEGCICACSIRHCTIHPSLLWHSFLSGSEIAFVIFPSHSSTQHSTYIWYGMGNKPSPRQLIQAMMPPGFYVRDPKLITIQVGVGIKFISNGPCYLILCHLYPLLCLSPLCCYQMLMYVLFKCGIYMLSRLALNSWDQWILLPWPSE